MKMEENEGITPLERIEILSNGDEELKEELLLEYKEYGEVIGFGGTE